MPNYRRVNTDCSRIDLSRSRLDNASARELVDCLNSGGGMGGLARLVHAMSDDELAPFVESLNRSLLNDPKTLFRLERTFSDLNERGLLTDAIGGAGKLLRNDELIIRAVGLFRSTYAADGQVDPVFLRALEEASTQLTPEKVADALDMGLVVAEARSLGSLWRRLTSFGGREARRLRPEIAEGLVAYAGSGGAMGRELVEHVINGNAFAAADALVPGDEAGIQAVVPGWVSVLDTTLEGDGRIASRVNALFGALAEPVPCFQGARAMRRVPMDMIRDLSAIPSSQASAFIQRDRLVQVYLTAPMCAYPTELAAHYPAMMELAASPAIEPMTDALRALYSVGSGEHRPMADYLVRALGDPAFKHLLPALGELQSRAAWEDLLLLATAPKLQDRGKLVELLRFLVRPMVDKPGARARGMSVWDVVASGMARVRPAELTSLLESVTSTEVGVADALRAVRAAFYVNDAHPAIELLQGAMADATRDPALINALLRVSTRPEFGDSIRELSLMARAEDGRLKDLLQTTLALFHRYAERGTEPIRSWPAGAPLPALRSQARHGLDAGDLPPWRRPNGATPADFGACRSIDLSRRWDEAAHATFESQFRAIADCANGDGKYGDLAASLRLLADERTETGSDGGRPARTFHALLVGAYNAYSFTRQEAALLTDWSMAAVRDGRALRALKALPIWVNRSLVRPLLDLAAPLASDAASRSGLKRLSAYGASVLKRDDFQSVLAYVDDLLRAEPPAVRAVARPAYDLARIARWVSNKECSALPDPTAAPDAFAAARAARALDIVDEYENAAIDHAPLSEGKLRRDWTVDALKPELGPVFGKFANVAENGPVLKSLLRFASRFNDPAQYPKGYLEKWLRDRAADRRLIAYMFPGETRPRVRLVNGLDRLSIMLLNADIYAPAPIDMNFGMEFLAKISESWGDVPFDRRPPEIQAKFPLAGTKPCPTLAETVAEIIETAQTFYELVGFPLIPPCSQAVDPNDPPAVQEAEKWNPVSEVNGTDDPEVAALQSSMYNLAQTVSALQENVDNGGLRVLRDLFFDLYYTGPAANRDSNAGMRNNLSVVVRMVKVGLLRQAGIALEGTRPGDPAVSALFQALIDGAGSPAIESVTNTLFIEDTGQELIWKILAEVLALREPGDLRAARSIGLNLMASVETLGKARTGEGGANELLDPSLRAVGAILKQHRAFLTQHADLVGDALKSADLADFLAALALDRDAAKPALLSLALDALNDPARGVDLVSILAAIDSDPRSHQAWKDFKARWDALDGVPEYQALKLSEIGRPLLNFLEGRDARGQAAPREEAMLARKILLQTADVLERDDAELGDQLLALTARKPEEMHRLVGSIGKLVENGEMGNLLDLMIKTLGPGVATPEADRR